MSPWLRFTLWLHRALARALPHEFRMRHGDDLERLGDDAAPFIWREFGIFGLAHLLAAALRRLVSEYASELRQDVRYAVRRLVNAPAFTAIGVVSLAISIGMSSLFLLQANMMTAPAAGVVDPETVVAVESLVSYPYFEEYAENERLFSSAGAYYGPTPFSVSAPRSESGERVFGHIVSPGYFETLGVKPLLGRLVDPALDKPGSSPTLVVSERFWRTRLGASRDAVGSTIELNGATATIVGVSQEGFKGAFPFMPVELFVPLSIGDAIAPELRDDALRDPAARRFRALFRLSDEVSLDEGEAALAVVERRLDERLPEADRPREQRPVRLIGGGQVLPLVEEGKQALWGFNGLLYGVILSMACINLAVLLLARTSERAKEVAVRLAVGAGRFRIVRQLLTESVVLAVAGGLAGAVLTAWLMLLAREFPLPDTMPIEFEAHYHWSLPAMLILGPVLAGLAFGTAPALALIRRDLVGSLKQGARSAPTRRRLFGLRNQFMLFQTSSSLTLLLITGFIVTGYTKSFRVDPGFDTTGLYLLEVDPARQGYSAKESAELLAELPPRLERLFEVRSAALSLDLPFSQMQVRRDRRVSAPSGKETIEHMVAGQRCGAGYFAVLGVPLARGREFEHRDMAESTEDGRSPIVLNRAAAQLLFEGDEPLGQVVREGERSYVVVGLVPDLKSGLMMGAPAPTMFLPLRPRDLDSTGATGLTALVRGAPGARALDAASAEIAAAPRRLPVFNARAFDDDLTRFNLLIHISGAMNGGLGVFGLALSMIGLFAVTAGSVAARRKEIGVRLALGAQRSHVLRLALREGATLVVVGGALGLAGAYGLAQIFSASISRLADLFAVGLDDRMLLAAGTLAWATLAMLACYLPARRSIRIDPVSTLRAE